MLPYFRGMEAFSISLPKSWSELSDQQLRFFFRQVARDLPMNEVLALCVCKWAEIVVFCHADKHSCLVKDRKSERQVVLADWQITFAARQLAFLESFAPKPVRISVIGGASASIYLKISDMAVILGISATQLREDIADKSTEVSRRYHRGKAASRVKLLHQEMQLAYVGSPLALENTRNNLLDMEDDE